MIPGNVGGGDKSGGDPHSAAAASGTSGLSGGGGLAGHSAVLLPGTSGFRAEGDSAGTSATISGAPVASGTGSLTVQQASKIDKLVKESFLGTSHKGGAFWKLEDKSLKAEQQVKDILEVAVAKTFTGSGYSANPMDDIEVTGYAINVRLETLKLYYKDTDGKPKIKEINLKLLAKDPTTKILENLEVIRKELKAEMKGLGVNFDTFKDGSYSELVVGKTPSFDSRISKKKYDSFIQDIAAAVSKPAMGAKVDKKSEVAKLKAKKEKFKKIRSDILSKAKQKLKSCQEDLAEIGKSSPTATDSTGRVRETDPEKLRKQIEDLEKMLESLSQVDLLKRGEDLREQDVDLACAIAETIGESAEYQGENIAGKEAMKRTLARDLSGVVSDYKVNGFFNFMKNKLSNISHALQKIWSKSPPPENYVAHDQMQKASKQFATDVAGLLYHFDPEDTVQDTPQRERYIRLCEHDDFKTQTAPQGVAEGILRAKDKSDDKAKFNAFAEFLGLDIRDE